MKLAIEILARKYEKCCFKAMQYKKLAGTHPTGTRRALLQMSIDYIQKARELKKAIDLLSKAEK